MDEADILAQRSTTVRPDHYPCSREVERALVKWREAQRVLAKAKALLLGKAREVERRCRCRRRLNHGPIRGADDKAAAPVDHDCGAHLIAAHCLGRLAAAGRYRARFGQGAGGGPRPPLRAHARGITVRLPLRGVRRLRLAVAQGSVTACGASLPPSNPE